MILVKKYRYKYGIIKNKTGDNSPYIGANTILNNEYILRTSSLLLKGFKYSLLKYTFWKICSSSILLSFSVHRSVFSKSAIDFKHSCIFLNLSSSFRIFFIIFCLFFKISILVVGLFRLILSNVLPNIVLVLLILLNIE